MASLSRAILHCLLLYSTRSAHFLAVVLSQASLARSPHSAQQKERHVQAFYQRCRTSLPIEDNYAESLAICSLPSTSSSATKQDPRHGQGLSIPSREVPRRREGIC